MASCIQIKCNELVVECSSKINRVPATRVHGGQMGAYVDWII